MSQDTTGNPDPIKGDGNDPTATGAGENQTNQIDGDLVGRLRGQKEHFQTKSEKLEAENADLRKKLESAGKEVKADPAPLQVAPEVDERLTLVELGQKGYSPVEVEFIRTYAKGVGKNPNEVLEVEIVKTAIEATREKSRLESGIPSSSSRTVPLKVNDKTVDQMSRDEHKANLTRLREEATRKAGGRAGSASRI